MYKKNYFKILYNHTQKTKKKFPIIKMTKKFSITIIKSIFIVQLLFLFVCLLYELFLNPLEISREEPNFLFLIFMVMFLYDCVLCT